MNTEIATTSSKQYNLNAGIPSPSIIEVDVRVLPKPWDEFCLTNRIRPHLVIGYKNKAKNIKLFPACNIFERGIERGEHLHTDAVIDSSSGNFVFSLAEALRQILEQDPSFPIKRVIAAVPRSLQPGKIALLRANKLIELEFADNAIQTMKLAEELARTHGYWYTRQYWNLDNSDSYQRMAVEIAWQLPGLGAFIAGVGSGGTFKGNVETLREAFKNRIRPHQLHCVAVAVKSGESVGGVRTELGLQLGGKLGLEWRILSNDVNYVGLLTSLQFSAALWQQSPDDPEKRIVAGESTGFDLAGGFLSLLKLQFTGELDPLRDEEGNVIMAAIAADTRDAYREDYEKHGISFPD